ncbi:MAG: endonuclease VIII [Oscillospiraceae bacterium]|jgi:formamidopyrimidine-DNA glycosylase|nr:endonuclease VIII [Oscillospiraceae bacterium]
MIELPEAQTLARQMNEAFTGKTIAKVEALQTPHGFAFFRGDPQGYPAALEGRKVTGAAAHGGRPELLFEGGLRLCLNDGVNMHYLAPGEKPPAKHQFLMEFDDGCCMACTVQMYGFFGLYFTEEEILGDFYYRVAVELPSPLSDAFDLAYFDSLRANAEGGEKLSAKAFLATQQRIPGLGNGVLQDILWRAGIHPKRKLKTLARGEWEGLFLCVKESLAEMTAQGGRNTEKDLHGQPGGYASVLNAKTLALPCPACGGAISRAAYLGGNVYFCAACQPQG